jgi:choline dehydrogenase-like flavoprotein
MHEVVIVGSGAAGVAAAYQFSERGLKPLILDVGFTRPAEPPAARENLYDFRRRQDSFGLLVGENYQNLYNLLNGEDIPVKLTAPHAEFVTRDAQALSPTDERDFHAVQSFAAGGLANAWGAGLYRFTDQDLEGFPIRASDLEPYFDKLTQEIGISGASDDLAPFFGSDRYLLPPVRLSFNANRIYQSYIRQKRRSQVDGFTLGLPRIGVLTEQYHGRPACEYNNLEFWQDLPCLYTPKITLDKLIASGKVDYRKGVQVESWSEFTGGIRIDAISLEGKQRVAFEGKKLVLAAGAINTAKIVLHTCQDTKTCLPLLDNPAFQIPFILPASVGRRLDTGAFGLVQLNLIWQSPTLNCLLQGSVMEITSPMRAVFFNNFPLAARANLTMIKYLLPAMLVMQLYFPTFFQPPARLSLQPNGRLRIQGQPNTLEARDLKEIFRFFRRIGAWTHPFLVKKVPAGYAIHYAGTLPMRPAPGPYECDVDGKLAGTQNVYIADGAGFPSLPAKNMSFAMMANAMRIADSIASRIDGTA